MKNIIIYNNYFDFNIIYDKTKKLINNDCLSFIKNSYYNFLQPNKFKLNLGIKKILNKIFPIYEKNINILINYINYYIFYPEKNFNSCILNGENYNVKLKLRLSLINFKNNMKLIQEFIFLDIPFITENKTFIINGIEKTVISKLIDSKKLKLFEGIKNKINFKFIKLNVSEKLNIYFFILKKKLIIKYNNISFNIIEILFYLGYNKKEIINNFYHYEYIYLYKNKFKIKLCENFINSNFPFDIKFKNELILNKYNVIENFYKFEKYNIKYVIIDKNYLLNRTLGCDIFYKKKKIAKINEIINYELINKLIKFDIKFFKILNICTENQNIINLNIINNFNYKFFLNKINKNFKILFLKKKFVTNNINSNLIDNFFFVLKKNEVNNNKNIVRIIKILIGFNDNAVNSKDLQNLENIEIELVGDVLENIIYKNFLLFKKKVFNIYKSPIKPFKILNLINFKAINKEINNFFILSEYSQFLDQTNFLSEVSHKRKVSLFSLKGISRKYSGFNVRDSDMSYYNRLCPVETPEGINIGLVNYLSILSFIFNKILYSIYLKKKKKNFYYLNVSEEKNFIISNFNLKNNKKTDYLVRYNNQLIDIENEDLINYKDIIPGQFLSLTALFIPFIEHNDSNRALMASNMLKQAVPLIFPDKPLLYTGIEKLILLNDKNLSKNKYIVNYSDSKFLILKKFLNLKKKILFNNKVFFIKKYISSNQNSNKSYINNFNLNDKIFPNEFIKNVNNNVSNYLSLGKNVNVAFLSWFGYNFEDSIIVSERLIKKDYFSSLNLYNLDIPIYYTDSKDDEEIFFNFKNKSLNEFGIIKVGSTISKGEIIINKIKKKNYDKIFNNILKRDFVNNDSVILNENIYNGKVIDVKVYFSRYFNFDDYDKKLLKDQINKDRLFIKKNFKFFLKKIYSFNKINLNFFLRLKSPLILKKKLKFFLNINFKLIFNLKKKYYKNLYFNIKKLIRIKIAVKRILQIGDKMSGRHGNKGVVSKIVPVNEMPYIKNGWPVDILLNPLGVSSRMNIGQLLEIHLGLASLGLSLKIKILMKKKNFKKLKFFLKKIYINSDIEKLSKNQLIELSKFLFKGVPFGVAPFNNFNEKNINYFLNLAFNKSLIDISNNKKQVYMYDGLTGKKFENPVTFGSMYLLKLDHLVENKIHSRSIGPYSLITQQPLKGKSKLGGQRLGEMEVWALQAYGAAYTLQEMLTVKSDDVKGRFEIYKNIIDGNYKFFSDKPRSFDVMINNINSLGIYIKFYD